MFTLSRLVVLPRLSPMLGRHFSTVNFTFVATKDGTEFPVTAEIGENLLEVAH